MKKQEKNNLVVEFTNFFVKTKEEALAQATEEALAMSKLNDRMVNRLQKAIALQASLNHFQKQGHSLDFALGLYDAMIVNQYK